MVRGVCLPENDQHWHADASDSGSIQTSSPLNKKPGYKDFAMISPLICGISGLPSVILSASTKLAGSFRHAGKGHSGGGAFMVYRAMIAAVCAAVAAMASTGRAQTAHFGWAQVTLSTNFGQVLTVAVDANGDVFGVDDYNSQVYEIVAVNGVIPASPTINTLGGGFGFLESTSVRTDASGNVFVANAVLAGGAQGGASEIPAAGGFATGRTLSTGVFFPVTLMWMPAAMFLLPTQPQVPKAKACSTNCCRSAGTFRRRPLWLPWVAAG
jgi:hypothetical protein